MSPGKNSERESGSRIRDRVFAETRADPSSVEIYVHRLRKKLEGSTATIATLRGLGYLLRHHGH